MKRRIRKGDTVHVLTGKDRGKKGRVLQVLSREQRVVVEGVNLGVRHVRPKRDRQKGQRVQFSMPLHISNVRLADTKRESAKQPAAAPKAAKKTKKPSSRADKA